MNRAWLTPFSAFLESSRSPEADSLTNKKTNMHTNYAELEVEAGSASVMTPAIESERSSPALIQTEFTDAVIFNPEGTSQRRNSRLVGFDRGTIRSQPYVGPKQF